MTRARRPGPRRPCGFTLVELLVALVIMAVISLMAWRGLDAMARAIDQVQQRSAQIARMQSALAQWTTDLDAMAVEEPTAIDWDGRVLRLTRRAEAGAQAGLEVVAWSVQGEGAARQWVRWVSPLVQSRASLQQAWLQAARADQGAAEALPQRALALVPLQGWQLYFYRGDAWSNALSSADAATTTPDGVRLVLQLAPGYVLQGTLTRDWVRPTLGFGGT